MYRRLHWNNRGLKSIVWRCISRGHVCHSRTVSEPQLDEIVLRAINQTLSDKETLIKTFGENIATVIRQSDAASPNGIDKRLNELQQELLKKAHKQEAYDTIASEIFRLRELRNKTKSDTAARDENLSRINDLQEFVANQVSEVTAFDETLVRRLIGKITVYEDRFSVEFKSGVKVEVKK